MYIPRMHPLQQSIFDIFRGGAAQPAPQPAAPAAGAPNPDPNAPPATGTQIVPQTTPKQQIQPPADDANKSPLAEFAKLWDTETPKEGQTVEPDWEDYNSLVPEVKVDPKKLVEAAKRIDFSKAVDPALVQKALKEGDVGAFNQILNSVLQASFANMAMSATKISENMAKRMAEKILSGALPHHLRKHTVSAQVAADNPIFSDPAVAPMLSMLEAQMRTKYPKASAKEISDLAKKHLTGLADLIKPGTVSVKGAAGTKAQDGETDWMDFANVDKQ